MEKDKLIEGGLLIIVVILCAIISQLKGWIDIMTNFTDVFIAFASFLLGIAFVWLKQGLFPKGVKKLKEIDMTHLTVLYSRKTDMPNKPNLAKPRYVVNNITKEAYWVSTPVDEYLNGGRIQWHTSDGKEALLKYLKDNNIHINERDATNLELGLSDKI